MNPEGLTESKPTCFILLICIYAYHVGFIQTHFIQKYKLNCKKFIFQKDIYFFRAPTSQKIPEDNLPGSVSAIKHGVNCYKKQSRCLHDPTA
jgi:hypothetical protein